MQCIGHEDHSLWQRLFWRIQAACGDIDFVGTIVVGERELGAAVRAERARGVRRRAEAGRLAGGQAEVIARHREPRHRRRAGGAAADGAVA